MRDLFPGNRIPAARMDPVAVNIAKYWPAPTAGNSVTGMNNYVRTGGDRTRKDPFSIRFDHHFNPRNRIFTRVSYDDSPINRMAQYEEGVRPRLSPDRRTSDGATRRSRTPVFGPSMLAIFRYSFTRLYNFRTVFSNRFDIKTLGFPASLDTELRQVGAPLAFPISNVAGVSTLGNTSLIRLGNDIHSWQAQLVKTAAGHSIKTGFEYRVIKFNNNQTDGVGRRSALPTVGRRGPTPPGRPRRPETGQFSARWGWRHSQPSALRGAAKHLLRGVLPGRL